MIHSETTDSIEVTTCDVVAYATGKIDSYREG